MRLDTLKWNKIQFSPIQTVVYHEFLWDLIFHGNQHTHTHEILKVPVERTFLRLSLDPLPFHPAYSESIQLFTPSHSCSEGVGMEIIRLSVGHLIYGTECLQREKLGTFINICSLPSMGSIPTYTIYSLFTTLSYTQHG